MRTHLLDRIFFNLSAGIAMLACASMALADPPSRVARIGYMTGMVSFSPAGEDDWVRASINRPLTTGDRLWADAGGRAEIQAGGALIRMDADTGLSVLNLDDQVIQLQLTQGALNVRLRRLEPRQVFEVDTPNLAFTLRQPGQYRIEVDPEGHATTIIVRKGQGEVYGENASYVVDSRQSYRFTGTGLREYEYMNAPRQDEFDRWAGDRDRRYDTSVSARYVSQDVIGYQDLDANGTWRVDATYGNVWFPSRVASGWAPYRDGHWAWVDPWGWTWIDDAPWGFTVSHYGRWTNLRGSWGWVPGPVRSRAYYAPALVAFVGGDNFQIAISTGNVGGVAWFPLGPREVYRPSYAVSRGYFENVNVSNTVINTTVINNYYNNTNVTNVVYANRQVPGAVVAVPRTVFVQSQSVSRATVRVSAETISSGPVAAVAPVAPTERSVRGAADRRDKPPPRVFERPVVARTAPPAARVGFAAQQEQLTAKPGQPLDESARSRLKPAPAAQAPVVRVIAPTREAASPARLPPAVAAKPQEQEKGKGDARDKGRGQPAAPPSERVAAPKPVAPPQPEQRVTAPKPVAPAQADAAKAPPPQAPAERLAAPKPVAPPKEAAPKGPPQQAAAPAPAARPPEQRQRDDPRGKGEQRVPPTTAPPPPAERVAAPKPVAPPKAVTPAPVVPAAAEQKAATDKPKGKGKDADEQEREEEARKKKS